MIFLEEKYLQKIIINFGLTKNDLIYPLFVVPGEKIKKEVKIVDRNENFCLLDGKYTGKEKVFIL